MIFLEKLCDSFFPNWVNRCKWCFGCTDKFIEAFKETGCVHGDLQRRRESLQLCTSGQIMPQTADNPVKAGSGCLPDCGIKHCVAGSWHKWPSRLEKSFVWDISIEKARRRMHNKHLTEKNTSVQKCVKPGTQMAGFSIFFIFYGFTAYSLVLFKARRLFFYLRNIKEKSLLDTVPNFF